MSILDDAIREHLELKRAHGADEAELKKLEDEAFGPPQRPDEPDPFAEAPTEFLTTPDLEASAPEGEGGRRVPNLTDLQEAPPAPDEAAPPTPADEGPAEEEHPAAEHEVVGDTGPTTEERHAIAEQPTEMFDVEGQFEDASPEADAPSDEQLLDAELAEPRLAPVDPIAGIEAAAPADAEAPAEPARAAEHEDEPADEFDEFFSEQRLSDELNRALEAPLPDEPRPAGTEEATAIFDVEDELHREDAAVEADDDLLEEDSEEYEIVTDPHGDDEEPEDAEGDAPAAQHDSHEDHDDDEEHHDAPAPPAPAAGHDDLLEDTPDFLQDDPEDDNLWFEQKPPKDIDFGD